MTITPEMEPVIQALEAKHPDRNIRAAVHRLHENDFAAMILQHIVDQARTKES